MTIPDLTGSDRHSRYFQRQLAGKFSGHAERFVTHVTDYLFDGTEDGDGFNIYFRELPANWFPVGGLMQHDAIGAGVTLNAGIVGSSDVLIAGESGVAAGVAFVGQGDGSGGFGAEGIAAGATERQIVVNVEVTGGPTTYTAGAQIMLALMLMR